MVKSCKISDEWMGLVMIQTKDFKIPHVVESIEEDAKEIGFTIRGLISSFY